MIPIEPSDYALASSILTTASGDLAHDAFDPANGGGSERTNILRTAVALSMIADSLLQFSELIEKGEGALLSLLQEMGRYVEEEESGEDSVQPGDSGLSVVRNGGTKQNSMGEDMDKYPIPF